MLTSNDVQLIKATRTEITANRLKPVTLVRETVVGTDPYTGEPIKQTTQENIQAVVKGVMGVVGGERLLVNGFAVQAGDIRLDIDISVSLDGVKHLFHDGVKYSIQNVTQNGLGGVNRYDVIARRVM